MTSANIKIAVKFSVEPIYKIASSRGHGHIQDKNICSPILRNKAILLLVSMYVRI